MSWIACGSRPSPQLNTINIRFYQYMVLSHQLIFQKMDLPPSISVSILIGGQNSDNLYVMTPLKNTS